MNCPFLNGGRIYLRPLDEADLDRCLRWINDPELIVRLGRRHPMSRMQEREWLLGQYKSESHDSTTTGSGDNATTMQMTRWSLQALSVLDKTSDDIMTVSVKIDSAWDDQASDGTMTSESGGRRMVIRRGPGGPGGRRGPQEFKIKPSGESATKDPVVSPLLVPLPEDPVGVNDTWEFDMTVERKGRMSGTTQIQGQCLVYDIQKQGNQTLALIIVNTASEGTGEFKFQRGEGMAVSGSTQTKGAVTSLVYFDVEKGRITEIVTDEKRDTATESTMFSSTMSMKTTSTIKLISEE